MSPSPKGVQKKGTSEITDEGAVRKKDCGEAGVETLQLPKPYNGRPGAGCRLMAEVYIFSIYHKLEGNWKIFFVECFIFPAQMDSVFTLVNTSAC